MFLTSYFTSSLFILVSLSEFLKCMEKFYKVVVLFIYHFVNMPGYAWNITGLNKPGS